MAATVLSNLQKELLKLYSAGVSDEQLHEIKLLLGNYFAEKATQEMDRLWDENNWSEETMTKWANDHKRLKSGN